MPVRQWTAKTSDRALAEIVEKSRLKPGISRVSFPLAKASGNSSTGTKPLAEASGNTKIKNHRRKNYVTRIYTDSMGGEIAYRSQ